MSLKHEVMPRIEALQHELSTIHKLLAGRGDYAKCAERIAEIDDRVRVIEEQMRTEDDMHERIAELERVQEKLQATHEQITQRKEQVEAEPKLFPYFGPCPRCGSIEVRSEQRVHWYCARCYRGCWR